MPVPLLVTKRCGWMSTSHIVMTICYLNQEGESKSLQTTRPHWKPKGVMTISLGTNDSLYPLGYCQYFRVKNISYRKDCLMSGPTTKINIIRSYWKRFSSYRRITRKQQAMAPNNVKSSVKHPYSIQWLPRFRAKYYVPILYRLFLYAKIKRICTVLSGFWRFGTKFNGYSRESGARVKQSRDKCSPTEVMLSSSITLCCW